MKKEFVKAFVQKQKISDIIASIEAGACSPVCSGCFIRIW